MCWKFLLRFFPIALVLPDTTFNQTKTCYHLNLMCHSTNRMRHSIFLMCHSIYPKCHYTTTAGSCSGTSGIWSGTSGIWSGAFDSWNGAIQWQTMTCRAKLKLDSASHGLPLDGAITGIAATLHTVAKSST